MPPFLRGLAAFVVAVAALFFVGGLGGALLSGLLPDAVAAPLGFLAGVASAYLAGRWIWRSLGPVDPHSGKGESGGSVVAASVVTGALLLGGIGFVGGFFGPMLLAPQANQGPMLGIFITGPGGVVLGAVAGGIYGMLRVRRSPGAPAGR